MAKKILFKRGLFWKQGQTCLDDSEVILGLNLGFRIELQERGVSRDITGIIKEFYLD